MPQAAALVVVAIAAVASTAAAVQQNRAQKRAAGAQQDAADTASAQQKNQEMEARRQQVRQQRIRTAQVQQAASSSGASQSSGELGSLSALGTNVGANLASMASQSLAAQGIGAANQRSLDYQQKAQQWGMYGQVAGSIGSLAGTGAAAFNSAPTGQAAPISQAVGTPTGHN
ncbi:MAG: hypothetical protein [Bacteriophage sp.]|nr:MAG: hypothetical protein [Bacteriophage sp.]